MLQVNQCRDRRPEDLRLALAAFPSVLVDVDGDGILVFST